MEAVAFEIIERKGSWFSYNGENMAQGAEATIELIRNNPSLFEEIREKLMKVAFEEEEKVGESVPEEVAEEKAVEKKPFKKSSRRGTKKA